MISEELQFVPSVGTFGKGNLSFIRLLMQYGRGTAQRRALQTMLNGSVKHVMATHSKRISTDPISVSRGALFSSLGVDRLFRIADLSSPSRGGGGSHWSSFFSPSRGRLETRRLRQGDQRRSRRA